MGLVSLLPFQEGLTYWAGAKHSPPSAPLAPSFQTKGSRDNLKHRNPCPSFLSTKAFWVGSHSSCCRVFHRSVITPTMLSGAAFIGLITTEVWGHILSPAGLPRAGQDASSKPHSPWNQQLHNWKDLGATQGWAVFLMSKLPPVHATLH